jgi:hypothetical protein
MRIVVVFLIVLAFLMLRLPYTIRGDATLTGRLQNFLDYSLAAVGILLALTTVMLAAATLSKEFETRTLHLIVTKPVTRFQILLGKWLGVNVINLFMLLLCGVTIYGFSRYIRNLPTDTRSPDQLRVENVVWTARAVARPAPPLDEFRARAGAAVDQMLQEGAIQPEDRENEIAELMDQYDKQHRSVPPWGERIYRFTNLPPQKENAAVQIQYEIRPVPYPADEMARVGWAFLDPETERPIGDILFTEEQANNKHQFLVDTNAIRDGTVALMVINPANPNEDPAPTLRLIDEDALQLLYQVGSFEVNYVKAVTLVFLRLAFLAAVGLFFGTFVSFPVAVFCGMTWYLVSLGRPFWLESLGFGEDGLPPELLPFGALGAVVRPVLGFLIQLFFPDFVAFSGGRYLVDGRYIDPALLVQAATHTLGLGLILLFLVGWFVFKERQVAAATTS